jgi:ATP-dependent Zn protease
MLFGGRAAEEVILGQPTGGAGGSINSDLAKATRLAIAAEVNLGLGSTGLIWGNFDDPDKIETILATRPATEQAVRRRLDAAYAGAKSLISQNRTTVEALADALLDRVVLTSSETADIFNRATNRKWADQNKLATFARNESSGLEIGEDRCRPSA